MNIYPRKAYGNTMHSFNWKKYGQTVVAPKFIILGPDDLNCQITCMMHFLVHCIVALHLKLRIWYLPISDHFLLFRNFLRPIIWINRSSLLWQTCMSFYTFRISSSFPTFCLELEHLRSWSLKFRYCEKPTKFKKNSRIFFKFSCSSQNICEL